jgi:hypothetical protein
MATAAFSDAQTTYVPTVDGFSTRMWKRAAPWIVGIVAVALGLSLYANFREHARQLWYMLCHDRSAHYVLGLNLALDLRTGNLLGLLHHLDGARVWGPVHGILLALIELGAGLDYRLGVLPSLCAWMATIVLGFLVTRRLLPHGGTAAGVLAALFIALSPAHRAFATDIMLESMGAALTVLCLLLYLQTVQDEAPHRGRRLGLALTVLFLTKSNYWLLVVIGLTAGECLRQRQWCFALGRQAIPFLRRRQLWLSLLVNPWNILTAALIGSALAIVKLGGMTLHVGRYEVSVLHPHNLVYAAFVLVFVRAVLWWRRHAIGQALLSYPVVRDVLYWHCWPVACYFLLPKRLGYFLWFVSPANALPGQEAFALGNGVAFYFHALQQDYHVFGWTYFVVLAALGLAVLGLLKWRAGAGTVVCFLALAFLATSQHPVLKNRHVHSWVAVLWVVGAAGLVHTLVATARQRATAANVVAACLAVAVVGGHWSHWLAPGRAEEGGLRPELISALYIPETYLPALQEARSPTVLANVYSPPFLSWTYQEMLGRRKIATEIKGFSATQPDVNAVRTWAQTTTSDALVLIEVPRDSQFFSTPRSNLDLSVLRGFLTSHNTGFELTQEWTLPEQVRITMWTKGPARLTKHE